MIQMEQTITNEWLAKAEQSVLFTTHRPNLIMERGEGMYLWDTEGKRYLDFVGGWAVASLGHSPQALTEALTRQARASITNR
jgi:acetylornithine/N-succinyldiaminopimelate aminotransferase